MMCQGVGVMILFVLLFVALCCVLCYDVVRDSGLIEMFMMPVHGRPHSDSVDRGEPAVSGSGVLGRPPV